MYKGQPWEESGARFRVALQIELRREARHLEKDFKEHNRQALLNVLSDGTSASLIFGILARRTEGRAHFFRTLSRFASGLSDTGKAFLIIASELPLFILPL